MTSTSRLAGAAFAMAVHAVAVVAHAGAVSDHLRCHRIAGRPITKRMIAENGVGRALIVKLMPRMLCLPTTATCEPPASCLPGPTSPAPGFECYETRARECLNPECTALGRFVRNSIRVETSNEFGIEAVDLGAPHLFCAPTSHRVVSPTTTTTTVPPGACGRGEGGLCGGSCPGPDEVCAQDLTAPGGAQCACLKRCGGVTLPQCGGGTCAAGAVCRADFPDVSGECICQPNCFPSGHSCLTSLQCCSLSCGSPSPSGTCH